MQPLLVTADLILQFLLPVEQLCRHNLQNDPQHLQHHILAAHLSLKITFFLKPLVAIGFLIFSTAHLYITHTWLQSCTVTTGFIRTSQFHLGNLTCSRAWSVVTGGQLLTTQMHLNQQLFGTKLTFCTAG